MCCTTPTVERDTGSEQGVCFPMGGKLLDAISGAAQHAFQQGGVSFWFEHTAHPRKQIDGPARARRGTQTHQQTFKVWVVP